MNAQIKIKNNPIKNKTKNIFFSFLVCKYLSNPKAAKIEILNVEIKNILDGRINDTTQIF